MSSFKISWNGPPVTSEPWLTDFLSIEPLILSVNWAGWAPTDLFCWGHVFSPLPLAAPLALFLSFHEENKLQTKRKLLWEWHRYVGTQPPTEPKLGDTHWAPTELTCSKAAWYKPSACWPGPACWLPAVSKLWDVVTCTTTAWCSHQSCCCDAAGLSATRSLLLRHPRSGYSLIFCAARETVFTICYQTNSSCQRSQDVPEAVKTSADEVAAPQEWFVTALFLTPFRNTSIALTVLLHTPLLHFSTKHISRYSQDFRGVTDVKGKILYFPELPSAMGSLTKTLIWQST